MCRLKMLVNYKNLCKLKVNNVIKYIIIKLIIIIENVS